MPDDCFSLCDEHTGEIFADVFRLAPRKVDGTLLHLWELAWRSKRVRSTSPRLNHTPAADVEAERRGSNLFVDTAEGPHDATAGPSCCGSVMDVRLQHGVMAEQVQVEEEVPLTSALEEIGGLTQRGVRAPRSEPQGPFPNEDGRPPSSDPDLMTTGEQILVLGRTDINMANLFFIISEARLLETPSASALLIISLIISLALRSSLSASS